MSRLLLEISREDLFELVKAASAAAYTDYIASHPQDSNPQVQLPQYLSPAQVCTLLNISRPTLISYGKKNLLRGKRAGGKVFYSQKNIEKFLSQK